MTFARTAWVVLILFLLGEAVAAPALANTWNRKTDARLTTTILQLAFLVLYSLGALLLVYTAHNDRRLVREFGVRAMATSAPADANVTLPTETRDQDKDEAE
jgi:biotin transporter BioY